MPAITPKTPDVAEVGPWTCAECGHANHGSRHYPSCSKRATAANADVTEHDSDLPADYCAGCHTDSVLGRISAADDTSGT